MHIRVRAMHVVVAAVHAAGLSVCCWAVGVQALTEFLGALAASNNWVGSLLAQLQLQALLMRKHNIYVLL